MSKHTPGPWKAVDEEQHWTIFANGFSKTVARIPIRKGDYEADEANALLIAQAPTLQAQNRALLAVLENVARGRHNERVMRLGLKPEIEFEECHDPLCIEARAAIAKGETE